MAETTETGQLASLSQGAAMPKIRPVPTMTTASDVAVNQAPTERPKKIILLSDGTGNSERSPFKTNVWRTYQALKLADGKQVAYYDNGVGTSTLRPLALLGGAFGWGLKRNVLSLYKFLCRKYTPGDEIYGFGFSRGAFTIRVLVSLVETQGLIRYKQGSSPPITEGALTRYAAAAYRAYRKERYRALLARLGRFIRDILLGIRDTVWETLGIKPYKSSLNVQVEQIRFLGLWDTVDAYGLPIRELKSAVDRYIWPLTFQNLELGEKVRTARHALALDDERATFHPLVWDERREMANHPPDRIRQVWFAGAHANVGGGYPDDSLAYVPLLWILKEAQEAGLEFEWEVTDLYEASANPFGKIYDSRAGRGAIYRYSPRRVDVVVDDSRASDRTGVALPKYAYNRALIHATVFERIADSQYAPISIHGPIIPAEGNGGPSRRYNVEAMELVLDTVWWRRTAYWVMMFLATIIIAFPWLPPIFYSAPDERGSEWLSGSIIVSLAKKLLPAFANPWIDGFATAPATYAVLILAGLATFLWHSRLRDRVTDRARAAWLADPDEPIDRGWLRDASESIKVMYRFAVLAQPMLAQLPGVSGWLDRRNTRFGLTLRLARVLRTNRVTRSAGLFVTRRAIPLLFIVMAGLAALYAANRVVFAFLNATDAVCTHTEAAIPELKDGTELERSFQISSPCFATGIRVTTGAKYRIELVNPTDWRDGGIDLANFPDRIINGEKRPRVATEGYGSGEQTLPFLTRAKLVIAAPMRRIFSADWLRPVTRIGAYSHEEYVLGAHSTIIEPQHSGELFFYVNDAVLGVPGLWDFFYRNNVGAVTIKIRGMEPPASY